MLKIEPIYCRDVGMVADIFRSFWVKHGIDMKSGGYLEWRQVRVSDYRLYIELYTEDSRSVWDAIGVHLAPSAQIRLEPAPHDSQKATLYVSTDPSDPKPKQWEHQVQEIFESFRAYLRKEGYLDVVGKEKPPPPEVHAPPVLGTAQPLTPAQAGAGDILPTELEVGGKYGTCRDLTIDDVRAIVAKLRAFQKQGGKVTTFYEQLNITPGEPRYFELETLRGWRKDPKFAAKDT